jgi:transcriptional regulator with XRE-family HTH domain
MNPKMVGSVVRTLRKRRGWTQEKLAEESSVSVRTIRRVESGDGLDDETRSSLEAAFMLTPGDLAKEGPGYPFFPDGNALMHLVSDGTSCAKALLGSDLIFLETKVDEAEHEPLIERFLALVDECFLWDELSPAERYADEAKITEVVAGLERLGWRVVAVRQQGAVEAYGGQWSGATVKLRIYRAEEGDVLARLLRISGPEELKAPYVH